MPARKIIITRKENFVELDEDPVVHAVAVDPVEEPVVEDQVVDPVEEPVVVAVVPDVEEPVPETLEEKKTRVANMTKDEINKIRRKYYNKNYYAKNREKMILDACKKQKIKTDARRLANPGMRKYKKFDILDHI